MSDLADVGTLAHQNQLRSSIVEKSKRVVQLSDRLNFLLKLAVDAELCAEVDSENVLLLRGVLCRAVANIFRSPTFVM